MNQPLVTIIIPLHHYEKYIADCLFSCVNQDYENVEIIVVDDASKDRSVEMVGKVRDSRIKLIRHSKNHGYSAAKNTALCAAKGQYVVHLDADDCLTQTGITERLQVMLANPGVSAVHGKACIIEGDRSYAWMLRKQYKLKIDKSAEIHAQAVMVNMDAYRKHGLYYEGLRSKADKEMWVRLREIAKCRFVKINALCAFYRKHPRSMLYMRNKNKSYDNEVVKIFKMRVNQLKESGITRQNTRFLP